MGSFSLFTRKTQSGRKGAGRTGRPSPLPGSISGVQALDTTGIVADFRGQGRGIRLFTGKAQLGRSVCGEGQWEGPQPSPQPTVENQEKSQQAQLDSDV